MSDTDAPEGEAGAPDTRPEELTIEQRARDMGWTPPEEWQGPAPKAGFLSAEEFVKRGETIIPMLRGQNRKLEEEIGSLKKQIGELTMAAQSLNEFSQRAIARERAENERLMRQLEARREQAVNDGDAQTAVAADREIARIAAQQQAPDPVRRQMVEQWLAENQWFQVDEQKRAWAEGFSRQLMERGYQPGPAILDAVAREARHIFPELNGGQARPGGVDGRAGRQRPRGNKRTFDDLPQEARDAYRNFQRLGVKMTPEQYLEQYDWSEGQ